MADVFKIKAGIVTPYSSNVVFISNTGFQVLSTGTIVTTGIDMTTVQNKYTGTYHYNIPGPSGSHFIVKTIT